MEHVQAPHWGACGPCLVHGPIVLHVRGRKPSVATPPCKMQEVAPAGAPEASRSLVRAPGRTKSSPSPEAEQPAGQGPHAWQGAGGGW